MPIEKSLKKAIDRMENNEALLYFRDRDSSVCLVLLFVFFSDKPVINSIKALDVTDNLHIRAQTIVSQSNSH